MKPRLSPPQVELLTDVATHPVYYVGRWSRWTKTMWVLIRLGLAEVTPGYHGDMIEIRITEAGRTEAERRGIGTAVRHP